MLSYIYLEKDFGKFWEKNIQSCFEKLFLQITHYCYIVKSASIETYVLFYKWLGPTVLHNVGTYTQMKTEKCLFMKHLLTAIWRLYFHPAKFDNFKDEKMSDYKTVSVAQSKNLLDWKPASLTNYELLLRAVFFYVFKKFTPKAQKNLSSKEQ